MTLRKMIAAAGGDLAAAAASYREEHGRLPTTQKWLRAGVDPAPAGLVQPRGGSSPSTEEGALVTVSVKLRPSTVARLEADGGSAGLALKRLVEG